MLINTNLSAYSCLRNFNNSNNVVAETIKKISSGIRVTSAKVDSASLAVSQKMDYVLKGIEQSLNNIQTGVSILQTAEGGYTAARNLLQRARKLAVQSANGTFTSSERDILHDDFWNCVQEIFEISNKIEFNGKKIFGEPTYAYFDRQPITVDLSKLYTTSETYTTGVSGNASAGTILDTKRGYTETQQIGVTDYDTISNIGKSSEEFTANVDDTDATYDIDTTQTKTLGNSATQTVDILGKPQDITNTLNNIYYEQTFTRGNTKEQTQAAWNNGDTINIGKALENGTVRVTMSDGYGQLAEGGEYTVDYNTGTITIIDNSLFKSATNTTISVEYWEKGNSTLTTNNNFYKDTVKVRISDDGGTSWNDTSAYNALIEGDNSIVLNNIVGNLNLPEGSHAYTYKVSYVKDGSNEILLEAGKKAETGYADTLKIKIGSNIYTDFSGSGGYNDGMTYDSANNKVIIDPHLFENGDTSLQVRYVEDGANDDVYLLPAGGYITKGASVKIDSGSRLDLGPDYTIGVDDKIDLNNQLTVSNSDFSGANPQRTININYFTDANDYKIDFNPGTPLDYTQNPTDTKLGSETVKINSVDTAEYSLINNEATVDLTTGVNNNNIYAGDTLQLDFIDTTIPNLDSSATKAWAGSDIYFNQTTGKVQVDAASTFVASSLEVAGYTEGVDYDIINIVNNKATSIEFDPTKLKGDVSDIHLKYITLVSNSFTLESTPLDYKTAPGENTVCGSEIVTTDKGIILRPDDDPGGGQYTIDGNTLTITDSNYYFDESSDKIFVDYARQGETVITDPYPGHDGTDKNGDDSIDENLFVLSDPNVISSTIKVTLDDEVQTEGAAANYTYDNPTNTIVFNESERDDRTSNNTGNGGLTGSYNSMKIEYLSNKTGFTLTKGTPLDYEPLDNTLCGSEKVYIEDSGGTTGVYDSGLDTLLTAGAGGDYTINGNAIEFTAAGLTKLKNIGGNPEISVDYFAQDGGDGNPSNIIQLTNPIGDLRDSTVQVFLDSDGDGVFDTNTEKLTQGVDYTIDSVNGTISITKELAGNPDIKVEYLQKDENIIQLSSTPSTYTGAVNGIKVWLDNNLLTLNNDYTVDTLNNQIILDENILTPGAYENANAADAGDDIVHPIKYEYTESTGNKLQFAYLNDWQANGANDNLYNHNAHGGYTGLPGVVWDADTGTYPTYDIEVTVDGNPVARDDTGTNGWCFTKSEVSNTNNWTNPVTGTNYRTSNSLYNNYIEFNGDKRLDAGQHDIEVTFTYDYFDEERLLTAPGYSYIRNVDATYTEFGTGNTITLNEDTSKGWELITETTGYDAFGLPQMEHYISFHGPDGVVDNAAGTPQIAVDYEYYSEENRTPFEIEIHTGPENYDKQSLTINPVSVYGLGLAELNIKTIDSAEEAIAKIDEVLSYLSSSQTNLGAQMNQLYKKYNRLDRYKETVMASVSQIRSADIADEISKLIRNQIVTMKNKYLSENFKSQPINLAGLIYSNIGWKKAAERIK